MEKKQCGESYRRYVQGMDCHDHLVSEQRVYLQLPIRASPTVRIIGCSSARTRATLMTRAFSFGGAQVTVTASFGGAGFRGDTAPAFSELISRADRALYRAKQLGRNRAEFEPLLRS